MRVDTSRYDNGKASIFFRRLLYRGQEVFEGVRLEVYLLKFEPQMTTGQGSLEHNGIRSVAHTFPFLAYEFKGPCRRDDGNQGRVARVLDNRQA